MSVPEHVRYRNSTMFVGKPPFGYESTEDRTPDACSSWHPPRTPPHDLVYRENYCTVPRSGTDTHNKSRLLGKSQSSTSDGSNVKTDDITPALFSSPKPGRHLVQIVDGHPGVNQLSLTNGQNSLGKRGSVSRVGGIIPLRATRCMRPLIPAKQNMHREKRTHCLSLSSLATTSMTTVAMRLCPPPQKQALSQMMRTSIIFCATQSVATSSNVLS
jgi:hypothetical protein